MEIFCLQSALCCRCTGADLNNICNHAAIQAAITGSSVVTMEHVEFAIDKVGRQLE